MTELDRQLLQKCEWTVYKAKFYAMHYCAKPFLNGAEDPVQPNELMG